MRKLSSVVFLNIGLYQSQNLKLLSYEFALVKREITEKCVTSTNLGTYKSLNKLVSV